MKITYTENPLLSIIELDEGDKEKLYLKALVDDLEDRIFLAGYHLEDGKNFDIAQSRNQLNIGLDGEHPQSRAKDIQTWAIEALKGSHGGDCTCVPCSCLKCHAEELLGIRTTEGLGKYSAAKIQMLFQQGLNIHQVIENLADYKVIREGEWLNRSEEEFNYHKERWKAEAQRAHDWLKNYQKTHFSKDDERV